MMEGLFSFDDQIFQESSNGKTKIEECYKAKNCHREWFLKCCPEDDPSETQNMKKYQGDLFYHRAQYSEALACYQESRQCLPPNSAVLDRELTESITICLWKLGKLDDAVSIIKEITDNQPIADSPVWHLLAQVYKDMGEVQGNVTDSHQVKSYCLVLLCGEIEHGEIESLQRCASIHPWNYRFWFSLALAYSKASRSCSIPEINSKGDEQKFQVHLCSDRSGQNRKEELNKLSNKSTFSSSSVDRIVESKSLECCSVDCKLNKIPQSLFVGGKEDKDDVVCLISGKENKSLTIHQHCGYSDCARVSCSSSYSSCQKWTLDQTQCCQNQDINNVKSRWKNHILSFCCLIKARFFLQKAIDASSSFVKTKHKGFLTEVNERINSHVKCGCVSLIDQLFQMLQSAAVIANGQPTEQESLGTNTESCKQETPAADVFGVKFEQKWFGEVLLHMM